MAILTRGDIPLSRDPSARFLPWLLGIMSYFAVLAAMGAIYSHELAARWDFALGSVVTVQVPAPAPEVAAADDARRMEQAMRLMRSQPGVSRVVRADARESAELLGPWLGADIVAELPLPRLFDLHFTGTAPEGLERLESRLSELYPGTVVDTHAQWMGHVATLTRTVEAMGLTVLALVIGAAVIAVIFAIRTSISIHREVISILHLIGAHDAYIASEFQAHVLKMALRGGIAGGILAVATLFALAYLVGAPPETDAGLLTRITQLLPAGLVEWAIVAATPLLVALVAWIAARFSVLGVLRRMNP